MKLKRVELYNFVYHKKSKLDLSNNGSYYICGENRDKKSLGRNACGKSLLMDGISWCNFGKTIRGFLGNHVKGKHATYCHALCIWEDDSGNSYKIERYRNHPKFSDKSLISISKDRIKFTDISKETTTETDEFITRILGCDHHVFCNGHVLTKLRSEKSFCDSTDSTRKQILTSILRLEWVDVALKKVKKDKKEIDDKNIELQFKFNNVKNDIVNISKNMDEYEKESEQFIREIKYQISLSKDSMKSSIKKITEKELRISEKDYKFQITAQQHLEDLTKDYDLKRNEIMELDFKKSLNDTKIIELNGEIDIINEKISDLSKGKIEKGEICISCGAQYDSKNIIQLKRHYKKERTNLLEKIKELFKKNSIIDKQIEEKNEKLSFIEPSMTIEEGRKKLEEFRIKFEQNKYDMQIYINEEKRIKGLQENIDRWKNKINPWPAKIEKLQLELDKNRNRIYSLINKINNNKNKINDLNFWIQGFGNSGIKNDIISDKISLLEDRINYYLNEVCDGDIFVRLTNKSMRGTIERIGMLIQDSDKIEPMEFAWWSGGEGTRIRWATEWALNSLLESPLDLVIIDEGFDKLSTIGVKRFIEMMQKEKDKKIICISNREEMMTLFDNRIEVILENGNSQVFQKGR